MKLLVPRIQSQRDSRWAGILLGYNTDPQYTIGLYGCLITCLANYLNQTPDSINYTLKNSNGFVSGGGLFIWSKSTAIGLSQQYLSPRYDGPVTDQGIQKVKDILDSGYPILCEVDFNPADVAEQMHFVLINGYDGDTIFAVDPWTGTQIDLDVYGGPRRAIVQFRTYDKTLPADTGTVMVPVESGVFENLVRKSTIYDKIRTQLNVEDSETVVMAELTKLIGYEDMVVQRDKQIADANTRITALESDIASLQKDHDDLTANIANQAKTIQDQDSQIQSLSTSLQELKDQLQKPPLTGWRLAIYKFLVSY